MKKAIFLITFFAWILLAWASPAYVAEKPYKIGVNLEFTGPWAEVTKSLKNAMMLEVERINKAGGVDGHPLELIFEDNGFDLGRVAANMTKFTRDKEILAVIGPFEDNLQASKQSHRRKGKDHQSHHLPLQPYGSEPKTEMGLQYRPE